VKQRVQLSGALKGKQVIASTDVLGADPDLRHGRAPRLLGHFGAHLGFAVDLDLFEGNTLFSSKALARMQ
jgi:hypothetical protein